MGFFSPYKFTVWGIFLEKYLLKMKIFWNTFLKIPEASKSIRRAKESSMDHKKSKNFKSVRNLNEHRYILIVYQFSGPYHSNNAESPHFLIFWPEKYYYLGIPSYRLITKIEISVSAQTLQFNWGFSCPKPVYYDPGGSEKKISAADFHFHFFTIEIIRRTADPHSS